MLKNITNKYEIISEINRGGMGTIYKALHKNLNRVDAIKVLHPHFASDESFVKRFQREALSMAKLEHQHIIRIYDVDIWEDIHFIAMEYIDGKDLKEKIIEKGKFSTLEAMRILRQVALALDFAHKHNIIHRDIKPGNILITDKDIVKVGDFGIAAATDDISITLTGQIVGTPEYMSPEQLRGDDVDQKMDLYSLGMVFYKMLTGKTPFDGLSKASVIGTIMNVKDELTLPGSEKFSIEIQNIIKNFFILNSKSRYKNAKMLIADIDNYIRQNQEKNAPKPIEIKIKETSRRETEKNKKKLGSHKTSKKRMPFTLIFASVIILIGVGAGYWFKTKAIHKNNFLEQKQKIKRLINSVEKEKGNIKTHGEYFLKKEAYKKIKNDLHKTEVLYKEAINLAEKGNFTKAIIIFTEANPLYEKIITDLSHFNIEVQKEVRQLNESIEELIKKALAIKSEALSSGARKSVPDSLKKADDIMSEGDIAKKDGLLQEAMSNYNYAINFYEKTKSDAIKVALLNEKEKKLDQKEKELSQREIDLAYKAKTDMKASRGGGAGAASKTSLYKNEVKLIIKNKDKNQLNNAIKRLIRAYERKNIFMMKQISDLSSSKETFLNTIFQNYSSIELEIEKIEYKKNIATAVILIKSLKNSTGDIVQPGKNWKTEKLTIPFDENGWGKIKW